MYLRVADPLELWTKPITEILDGLRQERAWSVFSTETLSPIRILAAFYGNREAPSPQRDPGFVIFTTDELVSDGGRLVPCPAHFDWPAEVSNAHFDFEPGWGAFDALASFDPVARLHRIPRRDLLVEILVLAQRSDASPTFRNKVDKRRRKLERSDPAMLDDIMAELRRRPPSPI